MIAGALKYLVEEMAPSGEVHLDDAHYWSRHGSLQLPPVEPLAPTIELSTLNSLTAYLAKNVESIQLGTLTIHVQGATKVEVLDVPRGRHQERRVVLRSTAFHPVFKFNAFHDLETFRIGLLSAFVADDDRARVLAMLAAVSKEHKVTDEDDGVGQTVTLTAGISRLKEVPVQPPVLAPYRTFLEVEQPRSEFVLRIRDAGKGGTVEAALFEGDGGAWAITARQRIADWIVQSLKAQGVDPLPQVIW